MDGAPSGFWAKLRRADAADRSSPIVAWHPLAGHAADVAACCEALLARPVVARRLARLGAQADLDDAQRARLVALAALHDVGKCNHGFQNKAFDRLPRAGHVREALALFTSGYAEAAAFARALGAGDLAAWGGGEAAVRLLAAAISHHGRPEALDTPASWSLWRAADGRDPIAGVAALAAQVRAWFPAAWEGGGRPLPGEPAFQHAFGGLVMLADWLGSDTRFFPYAERAVDRLPFAREAAARALRAVGLDLGDARTALGADRIGFDRLSPYAPRPAQAEVLALPAPPRGSVTVLEAKTGDGKTEAALARFLVLLQAGEVDGLYFALPTRTAATQLHGRVRAAVARAFAAAPEPPPVVLAVPGYLRVDETEGTRLPGFEVLWNDDDRARWRYRGWAAEHPKRYLAGSVVVGTIDQVLLAALAVDHAPLRRAALLRHLLVVDEVHASDTYMTRILEEVLRVHLQAGGHALLMSATLAAAARERLLWPGERRPAPALEEALRVPFPLVVHRAADAPATEATAPDRGATRRVRLETAPLLDDPQAVAARALADAAAGAKVLVLRNTVAGCLATQAALERRAAELGREDLLHRCAGRAAPHHARYARVDREALDGALEAVFGKEGRPPGGRVAVATQTVQQSLDLDADRMFTDLCPMDVLLQRLGRLHRHDRDDRPAGFGEACAVALTPAERDLGRRLRVDGSARGTHGLGGQVYPDLRGIEATWRLLEGHPAIAVPDDCRALVEGALHPALLDALAAAGGPAWRAHGQKVTGVWLADARAADLNLARWDVDLGERGSLYPGKEEGRKLPSRLGESDRLVRFAAPFAGPFGLPVDALTIPAWLAGALPADAEPEDVEPQAAGGVRFRLGERTWCYDRCGLRPAEPAAPRPGDDAEEDDA